MSLNLTNGFGKSDLFRCGRHLVIKSNDGDTYQLCIYIIMYIFWKYINIDSIYYLTMSFFFGNFRVPHMTSKLVKYQHVFKKDAKSLEPITFLLWLLHSSHIVRRCLFLNASDVEFIHRCRLPMVVQHGGFRAVWLAPWVPKISDFLTDYLFR